MIGELAAPASQVGVTPPMQLPDAGRTLVLGVLNVTPDSFSDGRPEMTRADAVRRGLALWHDGADLVDIGGESTRPGSARTPVHDELQRVVPVVAELANAGVRVSIDTVRREVAEAAVAAGASLINDVSGGRADPSLLRLVAECGLPYVIMHSRGPSIDMKDRALYGDVVEDVVRELRERMDSAVAAGVDPEQVIVDPGLGFAKSASHNWQILANLEELSALGRPVLVGASRKSFLGGSPVGPASLLRPVSDRDGLTAALTAILAVAGVWAVRVHDVCRSVEAVQVAAAMKSARLDRSDLYTRMRSGNVVCAGGAR
jgi:dihydropteroate synthase